VHVLVSKRFFISSYCIVGALLELTWYSGKNDGLKKEKKNDCLFSITHSPELAWLCNILKDALMLSFALILSISF
jgi:hypothetical protein